MQRRIVDIVLFFLLPLLVACGKSGDVSAPAAAPVKLSCTVSPSEDVSGFTVLESRKLAASADEKTALQSMLVLNVTNADESTPATLISSKTNTDVNFQTPVLDLKAQKYQLLFIASTYDLSYDESTGLLDVKDRAFSMSAEPVTTYACLVSEDLTDGQAKSIAVSLPRISATVEITIPAEEMFPGESYVFWCSYSAPEFLRPTSTGLLSVGEKRRFSFRQVWKFVTNTSASLSPKTFSYDLLCPESRTTNLGFRLFDKNGKKVYIGGAPMNGPIRDSVLNVSIQPAVRTVINPVYLTKKR